MKKYTLKQEVPLVNIYLIIQFFLYLMFAITGSGYYRIGSLITGTIGMILYMLCNDSYRINKIMKLAIIIAVSMLIVVIIRDPYNVSNVLYEILVYLSTACILTCKSVNRKVGLAIFYGVAICIVYEFLRIGSMRFLNGMSENSISIILIISILPYLSTFRDEKETPSVLPMLFCLILCILSVGRGGIIMGALLVLCFSLKIIFDNKHASGLNILICMIAIIAIAGTLFLGNFLTPYLYKFASISEILTDSSRKMIWSEYLGQSLKNIRYLLFGFPSSQSLMIYSYKNNMHNSFINTHVLMGIIGVIIVIGGLFRSVKYLFKTRKWNILIFLFVFVVRSFTDWVFPLQMGSVALYYLILLPIIEASHYSMIDLADETYEKGGH